MEWCQRKRREDEEGVGRCLWSLNWHSQTSVVIYLSHPSDSNSYTLRCLYILTLGLQGHNLKRYPVKNVEKYKIKIDMFGGKANEGKGWSTRNRKKWNHSPKDSRSLTTEQNEMLSKARTVFVYIILKWSLILNVSISILYLVLHIILLLISVAFIYQPRCQRWLRVQLYGKAQVSFSCLSAFHCWRKESDEDEKKHT